MLISKHWLQKFFDTQLPETATLADAITLHAFEIDGVSQVGGDDVLDVKITPNRGHDCLSHRGIAKEVSAILKIPLAHDPLTELPVLAPITSEVQVSIEDPEFCTRYIAGYVRGVSVGPSPAWLKKNLEALGQRSINNVVDATNFVMFNIGQPLHAFDASKLEKKDGSYSIAVRRARSGERMMALDHKEYAFTHGMSVIADAHKDEAIGIAGIKGGMPAGVTEDTHDIIIECANFAGVPVRKTAAALKLRTDASARYEQVITPVLAAHGMHLVCELIRKIAGGELVGFVDVYPTVPRETHVAVTIEKINAVLGTALTGADVSDVFVRLGFPYKEQDGVYEIIVPAERLDVTVAEDLIEEIVRIIGYDKITGVMLPAPEQNPKVNAQFFATEKAREKLVSEGYSEVYTSVFADVGERAVLNKVDSVKPFMRTTLIDGLTDALKKNIPNKDLLGLKEIKLFEIGMVWRGGKEVMMLATISEKKAAEEHELEAIDAESYEALVLSEALQFAPYSKYPYIVRDIAFWTPASTNQEDVEKLIQSSAGGLARRVALFDRFEKGERVSLGFRIIFQSFERTLTEVEVNEIMQKVGEALVAQGFEIR